MPDRLLTPCKHCGCPNLTRNKSGYCDDHQGEYEQRKAEADRRYNKSRGSAASQGYDYDWQQVRARYLRLHPLCEICQEQGKTIIATLVHHKTPIQDGGARLDFSNMQALCNNCHEAIHGKDRWRKR